MRTILVALALVLIASASIACNSSGDTEESVSEDSTPTTEADDRMDETELASSLLLTVDDFPSGWAEEPPDDEDEESPLDECDPEDSGAKTGEAETGDFSRGSGPAISHSVAIFDSAQSASEALSGIEDVADCFIDKVNEGAADDDDVEASDASFSRLSFPDKGDESRAYRIKFHVKAKGQSGLGSEGDVYFDVVYATVGRVGVSVVAFATFSAPEPSDWEEYVDIAIERAATAE